MSSTDTTARITAAAADDGAQCSGSDVLVYTTSRTPTGRGRPDPGAPAAGATYRLHRVRCRHAQGSSATPVTLSVWNTLQGVARATDQYLLCKVCRPEEERP
jgi:hypothetical protein